MTSTRERLISAAFELFSERGFDASTVDDVAERAGVSRTTFFRHFRSKEDAIFPDHPAVIRSIEHRLQAASEGTALLAVTEGARLVLAYHVGEGPRARTRYYLTRTVAALRAREIASQQQYQRTFRTYLDECLGEGAEPQLRAELLANAVVTAHNHVLRRWLREETGDEECREEFDRAMAEVRGMFAPFFTDRSESVTIDRSPAEGHAHGATAVVVLRTDRPTHDVIASLQHLLAP